MKPTEFQAELRGLKRGMRRMALRRLRRLAIGDRPAILAGLQSAPRPGSGEPPQAPAAQTDHRQT